MDQQNINLIGYLKMAAELESSVYRQEEAIKEIDDFIKLNDPQKKYNMAIENAEYDKLLHLPKEEDYIWKATSSSIYLEKTKPRAPIGAIIFFILTFILGIFLFYVYSRLGETLALLSGLLFAGMSIIATIKVMKEFRNKEDSYRRREEELQSARTRFQRDYNAKLQTIENNIAQAKQSLPEDKKHDAFAKKEREKMYDSLNKTKSVLSNLYENEIIYPKYHNMVAMCSIYEYFVTGRCAELTGPDGAYNLYEQELRQNTIINKLDIIIKELEAIKNNQYMLYQEMTKTAVLLDGIKTEMSSIYYSVEEIKDNTFITAQCSQITAQNTEALKYIALINR